MRKEWFIQSHENGEDKYIPLNHIFSILKAYKTEIYNDSIVISLPEGVITFYLDTSSEGISLLKIN